MNAEIYQLIEKIILTCLRKRVYIYDLFLNIWTYGLGVRTMGWVYCVSSYFVFLVSPWEFFNKSEYLKP